MDRFSFLSAILPIVEARQTNEQILFEGRCCFHDLETRRLLFFRPSTQNEDCTEISAKLIISSGDFEVIYIAIWPPLPQYQIKNNAGICLLFAQQMTA
jgi:hypothetical protein